MNIQNVFSSLAGTQPTYIVEIVKHYVIVVDIMFNVLKNCLMLNGLKTFDKYLQINAEISTSSG